MHVATSTADVATAAGVAEVSLYNATSLELFSSDEKRGRCAFIRTDVSC